MPNFILLTGAGFSRNWGGWLADEAFEYLLGHPRIEDGIRTILWRFKDNGGFEAALEDQRVQAARFFSAATANPVERLDDAIRGMFADMNKVFAEMTEYHSNFGRAPQLLVTEFLSRFDAIFTLNQDLLIEQQYLVETLSMMRFPKQWYMPGMESREEPAAPVIKDVREWRPMDPDDLSKFTVDNRRQPYFKLHGSSNWVDRRDARPMLVIGANKPATIARIQS